MMLVPDSPAKDRFSMSTWGSEHVSTGITTPTERNPTAVCELYTIMTKRCDLSQVATFHSDTVIFGNNMFNA